MNTLTNDFADQLRQDILDAAHARFLTYGLGKTTMVEIADDVSMSAANLYRYFKNKQDIAAACAERCMASHNEHLKNAIRQKHLSATQRLTTFALEGYHYNYNMMKDTPKVHELVENVTHNKPDMVHLTLQAQTALIAEILAYGNETDEFSVDDIITTADTIHSAFLLFHVPLFLPLFSPETFEKKAHNMVELIIQGIRKR